MAAAAPAPAPTPTSAPEKNVKPVMLEEDDEFEDFPVEDWPQEEQDASGSTNADHLWEESWDDDDANEDFSRQLK
ncbi:dss1/sem1 [Ascosphaera apis ARSEF 7405]|uniref:26S proteasome complex subunit SEM1 n=1 Tax=Ascosphaera apis ARSEF 7405 TaxID=392613 RepID=A0A167VX52_9EURO|nr:dss1/sem1 [Ascosphaera apis ARSEF 7405]